MRENLKQIKPINLLLLTVAGIINAIGVTRIEAMGGYSNTPKTVIYFVLNRFQIGRMKTSVHEIDPTAYITISEVADVFKVNK